MKLRICHLFLTILPASAFIAPNVASEKAKSSSSLHLFNDLFKKAFENSPDLSGDKRTGSIDSGGMEESTNVKASRLTETQQKWRHQQQITQLEGKYALDMYLAGIPSRDPSNDLFAARTAITTRDKDIGLTLPEKPTCENVVVEFANTAKCIVETPDEDGFCSSSEQGDWIVKDGNFRFRVQVTGYTRTVQTTGTIQNVFWSNAEAKTTQTSTSYSVPEGWLYFEGKLDNPKKLEGVLKVEQSTGLLGAGTKMVPCGKFAARQQQEPQQ